MYPECGRGLRFIVVAIPSMMALLLLRMLLIIIVIIIVSVALLLMLFLIVGIISMVLLLAVAIVVADLMRLARHDCRRSVSGAKRTVRSCCHKTCTRLQPQADFGGNAYLKWSP